MPPRRSRLDARPSRSPRVREADDRDRPLHQLRDIGVLADSVFWKAADAAGHKPPTGWRCVKQNYLGQALGGIDPPMPASRKIVGQSQADQVIGAGHDARLEVEATLEAFYAPQSG